MQHLFKNKVFELEKQRILDLEGKLHRLRINSQAAGLKLNIKKIQLMTTEKQMSFILINGQGMDRTRQRSGA